MTKQILFLSNAGLAAWPWHKGQLGAPRSFYHDAAGWQEFSDYIGSNKTVVNYLLVDLIEEDFRRESVPHVNGAAHRALIERKLQAAYRDTPFRQASRQERSKEGRRDDRMLLSALTNVEMINPWVQALALHAAPLAGIYSLALLGQLLIPKLKVRRGPVLMLSQQSCGLRQSFYDGRYLQFSRLTPRDASATTTLAETIRLETDRTRKFLSSSRMLTRGAQLQVLVLCSETELPALEKNLREEAELSYRLVGMQQASTLLHLPGLAGETWSDRLFLSLLATSAPKTHYQAAQQTRHYQLWKANAGMLSAAAIGAAFALLWTGANVLDIWQSYRDTTQIREESKTIDAKYRSLIGSMAPTKVNPHNMKSAVDLEALLTRNAPTPLTLLSQLSASMEAVPEIRINTLQWETLEATTSLPAVNGAELPPSAELIGIPNKAKQQLLMEGELEPFDGDYRAALASLLRFKTRLEKSPGVQVSIIESPLDVKSSAPLGGKLGLAKETQRASFRLKILWNP